MPDINTLTIITTNFNTVDIQEINRTDKCTTKTAILKDLITASTTQTEFRELTELKNAVSTQILFQNLKIKISQQLLLCMAVLYVV